MKKEIPNRFLGMGSAASALLAVSALALMIWTLSPLRRPELRGHPGDAARGVPDESTIPQQANPFLASCAVRTINVQLQVPSTADKALREAREALAEGRLEDALQHCQEALRMDPKPALAYFLLGMIQMRRGNESEARQALIKSLDLDPAHSATHYYLGRLYLKANEFTAATNEFAAAIKLGDPSGAGHYGMALTLLAESHYAEAMPHLHSAVSGNPHDPERLFTLIGAELQLKQVDKVRSDLVRIRELFPKDPALAYRIGKALLEYSLPDDAEAEFERASRLLEGARDSAPPDLNVSDLDLQVARLRFDHHDYRGTLHVFDKIRISNVAANLRASAWHLEGQALVGTGKASEALDKLRQAAQTNPTNPEYLVHLTWAQLLSGDTKAAATTSHVAVDKWPEVPDVQLMQTLVKRESGADRAGVPLSQAWHVKGEGLVCCPCKTPCPCRSNAAPTHKHCENTGLIHIHRGHYGKVSLDGFNFVAVNSEMETRTAPDMLYVEPSATNEQLIALERIMQSFSVLQPSIIRNVERAPISFIVSRRDNVYEVKIPSVLEMRVRRELSRTGEPLFPTAALDQFSNTIEYARNVAYKFWDKNGTLKWDYSGRQANFRTIDLDSEAYTSQTMLIQFADGSGGFNKKQLELINSQKLPLLRKYPRYASVGQEH